jgi:probable F420-dependent oxidoreductase
VTLLPYGVALPNYGPLATPQNLLRLARCAEDLGIDSIWVSDHVVVPERIDSPYPYGRKTQAPPADMRNLRHCFEALSTLAFLAGATQRIRLGVSVYVLPLRNPILTAKSVASIDALSCGRVIFGCGVGWLREEFAVLHAPDFAVRGSISDAYLRVCKAVWSESTVQCAEQDYDAPRFHADPKPAQGDKLPIWVGGNSRAAMARAVGLGNGWHPIDLSPDELRDRLQVLHRLCAAAGRPPGDITISLRSTIRVLNENAESSPWLVGDADKLRRDVAAFAAAGANYLVLNLRHGRTIEDLIDQLEQIATILRC